MPLAIFPLTRPITEMIKHMSSSLPITIWDFVSYFFVPVTWMVNYPYIQYDNFILAISVATDGHSHLNESLWIVQNVTNNETLLASYHCIPVGRSCCFYLEIWQFLQLVFSMSAQLHFNIEVWHFTFPSYCNGIFCNCSIGVVVCKHIHSSAKFKSIYQIYLLFCSKL
jgi:hypothetical protein